jgi:hypothetical protein
MTIALATLFVFFIISIFWFIGNGIQILTTKENNIYLSAPLGFIISGLLIVNTYVLFELSIFVIFLLFLTLFFLFFFYSILKKNTFTHFKNVSIIYLPLLILFFFSLLFEENFYAFRGNIWDHFTNIALALTFEQINYAEISSLLKKEKFTQLPFKEYVEINNFTKIYYTLSLPNIIGRVGPPIFTSVIFQFKFLDIYLISYALKTTYLILSYFSFIFFLKIIDYKSKFKNKIFIISLIFTLSFWTLYIFESDAISQLLAYSASIIFFSYFFKIFIQLKDYKFQDLIFLSLSLSFIFLFYESQAIVFVLFLFFAFFIKLKTCIKNFKILFYAALLFILLTLPRLYNNTILALSFSDATVDYWGYFGSFILGRENIVLDSDYVNKIKSLLDGGNSNFLVFKKIIEFNFKEKYFFIFFNIFPSLLGFYFITPGVLQYNSSIISTSLFFIISSYVVIVFYKNIKNIFINKYNIFNFFSFIIFFYFCLSLVLIFKNNFYGLVKLYFYFAPIWFILIFFRFNSNKKNFIDGVNIFLLLIMSTFFIYKYSDYNYGISRIDSFPSTLKKELKISQNWSLKKVRFAQCLSINLNIEDYLQNIYVSMYLDSKNINYTNYFNKKINFDSQNKKCSLETNQGNFILIN